jgi:hypothetical protein
VRREQLPVYLDEFVFRHHRRRLPRASLQTLLGLGTGCKPMHDKQIRGAADVSKRSTMLCNRIMIISKLHR